MPQGIEPTTAQNIVGQQPGVVDRAAEAGLADEGQDGDEAEAVAAEIVAEEDRIPAAEEAQVAEAQQEVEQVAETPTEAQAVTEAGQGEQAAAAEEGAEAEEEGAAGQQVFESMGVGLNINQRV